MLLVPNNGVPMRNVKYGAFQTLPTRRERRAAVRLFEKKLKKHMAFKLKHGIRTPNGT